MTSALSFGAESHYHRPHSETLRKYLLSRRIFSLIVLLWIVVGTVHGLSRYSDIVRYGLDVPFSIADVGYFVLSYVFWVIITVVLLRVMREERFRFSFSQLTTCFVIGIALWLPIYFAYDYGMSTLINGGGWPAWKQKFAETSGSVVFFYAVIYALTFTLCGSVALASRARAAESEKSALEKQRAAAALELSEQQMQLMQTQLSPHFLFNCLSAISYLARNEDRKTLTDAVAKLGNLMRFTIENASRSEITINDELKFCQDYVGLQTLRFGNRFQFLLDTDSSVGNAHCPPFTIQPLIENVFRHVVEQVPDTPETARDQRIQIHAKTVSTDSTVTISVTNTRINLEASTNSNGHGTGIKNLETRLSHRYKTDYALSFDKTEHEFRVVLSFPRETLD